MTNSDTLDSGQGKNPKAMLRALDSRNFQLYFAGQLVSLIGTWMQMVAMQWLVYRLTDSALMLGLIGFTNSVPTLLLSPIAGVVADRWNRRTVQIVTQALSMLQAFLLAFLVWSKSAQVWQVVPLSLFLGVVNSFDAPARQAFIIDLVERKEDLNNAIAINSIMFNCARLVGPTVAGFMIAATGEAGCFFLNGVSFLAVIVALLLMHMAPSKPRTRESHLWQELQEGAKYSFGFLPVRTLLLFLALTSVMSMPLQTLLPVIVEDVFHGGSALLGFIMAASGFGSLLGGVYLARRTDILGLEKRIAVAVGMYGVAVIVLAFTHALWVFLPLAMLAGLGLMIQGGSSNMLVQTLVEDDMRGRVMAFYTMCFMGMMPIGSLIAGALADRIGTPNTFIVSGVTCAAGAVWFAGQLGAWREHAHPVYARRGLMGDKRMSESPEVLCVQEGKGE